MMKVIYWIQLKMIKTLKIFLDTVLANSMRDTKIKRNLEKNKK
ncbi:MAG: hypothetical protein V8S33_10145 [Intestinibacter bartlettii]